MIVGESCSNNALNNDASLSFSISDYLYYYKILAIKYV